VSHAVASSLQFCGATDKPKHACFLGTKQKTVVVILSPKSLNRSYRFLGSNRKTLHHLIFMLNQETVTTNFEPKPEKPSPPVLRPNRRKPFQWFWGQTIDKLSTLVLRLNQETRTPRLHVHSADRTRRHPTTEYPTCATILGPLHQVSYSYHDPRCCTSCRTYHLHTTRQANMILQTNKLKVKQW
jgi:hypothetical protein